MECDFSSLVLYELMTVCIGVGGNKYIGGWISFLYWKSLVVVDVGVVKILWNATRYCKSVTRHVVGWWLAVEKERVRQIRIGMRVPLIFFTV